MRNLVTAVRCRAGEDVPTEGLTHRVYNVNGEGSTTMLCGFRRGVIFERRPDATTKLVLTCIACAARAP